MKVSKKIIVISSVTLLLIATVAFLRVTPIKTFYYQTSTACNSNLFGGGDVKNFEYRITNGDLAGYNNQKSQLESTNIPQTGCRGGGSAPQDYTNLQLFVF